MLNKDGFWVMDDMLKANNYDPGYYLAFGEQSAGKTYSACEYAIRMMFAKFPTVGARYKFCYVRRYVNELQTSQTKGLFESLNDNGLVKLYSDGEWDKIECIGDKYYLQKWSEEKDGYVTDSEPCGYLMALNTAMKYKGGRIPFIRWMIFDEFISNEGYLSQEWNAFQTIISRIAEKRTKELWIILLGNSIDMYCPYFQQMSIRKAIRQEMGTIKTYYNRSNIPIVVERTMPPAHGRGVDALFDFDNNTDINNSINTGKWQIKAYPKPPVKPNKRDIYYQWWLEFSGETLQCDMYCDGNGYKYSILHPHKGNIHDKMNDYHYGDNFAATPMYHRFFTKTTDEMSRAIWDQYRNGLLFYVDKEDEQGQTGNLFEAYIDWCKRNG